jgi:hypothetical protein
MPYNTTNVRAHKIPLINMATGLNLSFMLAALALGSNLSILVSNKNVKIETKPIITGMMKMLFREDQSSGFPPILKWVGI